MNSTSTYIKLREIAVSLGFKDTRTILKWLREKGISCKMLGGEYVVQRWIYELKLELEFVEDLKIHFPIEWVEIFKSKDLDPKMMAAVFAVHPPKVSPVKVKHNKNHKKFI